MTSTPSASSPRASQTPPPSQSQHPPQPHESEQPYAEVLASYGIKVRDFAYESTLPPVKGYRVHKRQIQPGRRPLKRARDEDEDCSPNPFLEPVTEVDRGETSKRPRLQREATELALPLLPVRERVISDIEAYDKQSQDPSSQQSTWAIQGSSQVPMLYYDPDDEPYVDTPTVTPNGSLQWKEADRKPPQYSNAPLLRTESQQSIPCSPSPKRDFYLGLVSALSSPLSEPPASLCPSRSGSSTIPRTPSTHLSQQVLESPVAVLCPRYHLRDRARVPAPVSKPTSTPSKVKPSTKARSAKAPKAVQRLTRSPSFQGVITRSRQSAHSRAKIRPGKNSRTLRTRAARNAAQNGTVGSSGAGSKRR